MWHLRKVFLLQPPVPDTLPAQSSLFSPDTDFNTTICFFYCTNQRWCFSFFFFKCIYSSKPKADAPSPHWGKGGFSGFQAELAKCCCASCRVTGAKAKAANKRAIVGALHLE